jgi:carbon monoxide dehydrogenase subunit G
MKWLKIIGIMAAVIIGGSVAIVFLLGRLPNAGRIQTSTEINAPREKVWAFLDNEQNMKQWVSWLVDVKQAGPRGPNAVLTLTMRDENNGGQVMTFNSRCIEYVPGTKMTEKMESTEFDGTQSYLLTDLGNGRTRLDIDGNFHFPNWFANFMTPLIMPAAKSKMVGDLEHLKSIVEKS